MTRCRKNRGIATLPIFGPRTGTRAEPAALHNRRACQRLALHMLIGTTTTGPAHGTIRSAVLNSILAPPPLGEIGQARHCFACWAGLQPS